MPMNKCSGTETPGPRVWFYQSPGLPTTVRVPLHNGTMAFWSLFCVVFASLVSAFDCGHERRHGLVRGGGGEDADDAVHVHLAGRVSGDDDRSRRVEKN